MRFIVQREPSVPIPRCCVLVLDTSVGIRSCRQRLLTSQRFLCLRVHREATLVSRNESSVWLLLRTSFNACSQFGFGRSSVNVGGFCPFDRMSCGPLTRNDAGDGIEPRHWCRCVRAGRNVKKECYLVDPASSHMLVSKIKPCMCKYELIQTVKLRMAH